MIVRICSETNCRTHLSYYNPTDRCWEHRRAPRRIKEELDGLHVLRDDDWVLRRDRNVEVETWRPHLCSATFIEGLDRGTLSPAEREAYDSGAWLLPPEEEATL